jgi:hypothetical protein
MYQFVVLVVVVVIILISFVDAAALFNDLSCFSANDDSRDISHSIQYSFGVYQKPSFKYSTNYRGNTGWFALLFNDTIQYQSNYTSNMKYYSIPISLNTNITKSIDKLQLIVNYNNNNHSIFNYTQYPISLYQMGNYQDDCLISVNLYYQPIRGISIIIPRMVSIVYGSLLLVNLIVFVKTPLIWRRSLTSIMNCICMIVATSGAASGVYIHIAVSLRHGLFLEKFQSDTYRWFWYRSATSLIIVSNTFSFIAISAYLFMIIRYFFIRNLYSIMATTNTTTIIKWYRFITSSKVYLTTVILSGLLYSSLSYSFMIMDLSGSFSKPQKSMDVKNYSYLGAVILVGIVALIAASYDLLSHLKKIKKNGILYYLLFDDPLMFRIEFIVVATFLVIHIFYTVMFLLKSKSVAVSTIRSITVVISDFSLFFLAGGGFACLVEVLRFIRLKILSKSSQFNQQIVEDVVLEALLDMDSFELFKRYCMREMSLENILLWQELYEWRQQYTTISRSQVSYIIDQYLKRGCDYEVNVPGDVRKEFEEYSKETNDNPLLLQEIPIETTNRLYRCIVNNLCETFSRYCETREYKALLVSREVMQRSFNL